MVVGLDRDIQLGPVVGAGAHRGRRRAAIPCVARAERDSRIGARVRTRSPRCTVAAGRRRPAQVGGSRWSTPGSRTGRPRWGRPSSRKASVASRARPARLRARTGPPWPGAARGGAGDAPARGARPVRRLSRPGRVRRARGGQGERRPRRVAVDAGRSSPRLRAGVPAGASSGQLAGGAGDVRRWRAGRTASVLERHDRPRPQAATPASGRDPTVGTPTAGPRDQAVSNSPPLGSRAADVEPLERGRGRARRARGGPAGGRRQALGPPRRGGPRGCEARRPGGGRPLVWRARPPRPGAHERQGCRGGAGRWTGVRQTWGRGATVPGLRLRT